MAAFKKYDSSEIIKINEKDVELFEYVLSGNEDAYDIIGRGEDEIGRPWSVWKNPLTREVFKIPEVKQYNMGFNSIDSADVDKFVEWVEKLGECIAYWGVTGRTAHMLLAQQLAKMLPQYRFEIDYDTYGCKAYKL